MVQYKQRWRFMGWIILAVLLMLVLGILLISYICFYLAFYVPKKKRMYNTEDIPLPKGREYESYHDRFTEWVLQTRALPQRDVSVRSFDGLTLHGKYYEYAPGAVVELLFHGYRSSPEHGLCGAVQRCFALGRSALVVEQRACGRSEGTVITFGINEKRDCLTWLQFLLTEIDPTARVILSGVSMGAATVMMCADEELPPNVIAILADCGYTSPKEIIQKVLVDMKYPPRLVYPFIRLGARLYGHVDIEADSPLSAVKNSRLPIIFFHGEADTFVPCDMSRRLFEACPSYKHLQLVTGAAHGLAFPAAEEEYLQTMREFFQPIL